MKQGRAQSSQVGDTKREPIAHAVNPAAVSEIGIHQARSNSLPLYEGRGIEAPMQGTTNHPTGSQGKHR